MSGYVEVAPVPNECGVWYEIDVKECVLCGQSYEHRTRRPAPKPDDDDEQRYHFRQFACDVHFM